MTVVPGEYAGGYPETTELFVNGITPERVERVARVLPSILAQAPISPEPSVVANHWQRGDGARLHEGWLLERMVFERLHREGEVAFTQQRGHSLFVPIRGGLRVCSSHVEGMSVDTELTAHMLGNHDGYIASVGGNPQSRGVPEQVRLFNSVSVAGYITDLVITHNILRPAQEFAATDPPATGN
jgi:hypothetical protein